MLPVQCLVRPMLCRSARYLYPVGCVARLQSSSFPKSLSLSDETKYALKNLGSIKEAPAPALAYGFSGLIPFVSIPVYMAQTGAFIPELAFTQMAYSAVILSFLGGVRWGASLSGSESMKPDWQNLGMAVTPSLLGWTSLLTTTCTGNVLAVTGFSLCMLQDIKSSHYPSWYKSLRIILSVTVILALVSTVICQSVLPIERQNKTPDSAN